MSNVTPISPAIPLRIQAQLAALDVCDIAKQLIKMLDQDATALEAMGHIIDLKAQVDHVWQFIFDMAKERAAGRTQTELAEILAANAVPMPSDTEAGA